MVILTKFEIFDLKTLKTLTYSFDLNLLKS
jgi:hypothetical protein